MKAKGIKKSGIILLATFFSVACSDDLGNDSGSTSGNGPADGCVKITIDMPTASVNVRATEHYTDGEKEEYQVNDALIVFFEGSNETDATFLKACRLEGLDMENSKDANSQITTTSKACIVDAPSVTAGNKLYALAVVNPNGILTTDEADNLLLNGAPVFNTGDNTITALQKKLPGTVSDFISAAGNEKASFFMTNAPLSDKSGSDGNKANAQTATLTEVRVYKTRTEADNAEADHIYVERIVAKVSMEINSLITVSGSDNIVKVESGGIYDGDQVTLDGWVLNVTNKSTKLVRDVSDLKTWVGYESGNSRFLADAEVKKDAGLYRIFWAIDNNYSTAYDAADFIEYADNTTDIPWNTSWSQDQNVEYCLENTFNTQHQNKNETTSVLIKGVYNRSASAANSSFFIVNDNGELLSENDFINKVQQALPVLAGATITLNANAAGGYYNVADGKKLSDLLTVTGTDASALQNILTSLGTVKYYKDGTTYYHTTLIKHFGDSETPWQNETYTEPQHLGRYGMVRNTWYDVSIDGISGPGEPEIPQMPEEPDDTVEGYINISVNVLAWAVHTQSVNL